MTEPKHRLITAREFASRLSLSRSSLYRSMAADASFPKPVKLGKRRIAFDESETNAYIAMRLAGRDGAGGAP